MFNRTSQVMIDTPTTTENETETESFPLRTQPQKNQGLVHDLRRMTVDVSLHWSKAFPSLDLTIENLLFTS